MPIATNTTIFLWVLFVIFWILLLSLFYFKFWKSTGNKLKNASKSEKVGIIKAVGFWKYVLIQGILLGNALAILNTLINIFGNKITLVKFVDVYRTDLIIGILAGMGLWFLATRKTKEA